MQVEKDGAFPCCFLLDTDQPRQGLTSLLAWPRSCGRSKTDVFSFQNTPHFPDGEEFLHNKPQQREYEFVHNNDLHNTHGESLAGPTGWQGRADKNAEGISTGLTHRRILTGGNRALLTFELSKILTCILYLDQHAFSTPIDRPNASGLQGPRRGMYGACNSSNAGKAPCTNRVLIARDVGPARSE